MRQNKLTGNATLPIAGLRGLLAGFVIIIVLFAIAAFFVSAGKIPENAMRLVVCICVFTGSLTGSFIAAKGHAQRRFIVGAGLGLAMFIICFVVSAISRSDKFPQRWHLVLFAIFLVSGAFGGVFAAHSPKRRR